MRVLRQVHGRGCTLSKMADSSCSSTTEVDRSPPVKKAKTEGDTPLLTSLEVKHLWKLTLGFKVDYYSQFYAKTEADRVYWAMEQELEPYLGADSHVKVWGELRKIPRRQSAFGDRGLSYTFSGTTVRAHPWTPELQSVRERVEAVVGASFNFVLVNRYKDGSDHIGEHRDDESDLCRDAPIASVSLGQARDFVFRHKDSRGRDAKRKDIQSVKMNLQHGSLLVMYPPTNSNWYHSLPPRKNVHLPRINLTFRKMKLELQT